MEDGNLYTISAFPNPTNGQFDIILPTNEENVRTSIYTLDGKIISTANYGNANGKIHLNIENQPSGIYLIKMESHPDTTIRVIKK